MKILILNTSERTGGAAVAANRLMKALKKAGVDVSMLVRDKGTDDASVVSINTSWIARKINFIRFVWERFVIFLCNKFNRKTLFQVSMANTGTDLSSHPLVREADVIHLHWINQGFLSLADIKKLEKLGKSIVWTMHDMWPCTAICHYSYGCHAFMNECGKCPFLRSHNQRDLANYVFNRKRFLIESGIHIVAVSNWLKNLAEQSALTGGMPMTVIPNVLDMTIFKPMNKQAARQALSFPLKKKIILMGAARINDRVKGFSYLVEALRHLSERNRSGNYLLVMFGGIKGDDSFLKRLPIPYIWMGSLSDPSKIALLYAAADVTVVPSLYETFGQTIIEGMACGCPAVSFDNSGQTDIIDHKINGYLARYKDSMDLAAGIEWVLEHGKEAGLSEACVRKVASHYSESVVAEQYMTLYKQMICNNPNSQS